MKIFLILLAHTLLRFIVPLLVPLVLLFKKDGRLPFFFLETPDDLYSPYGHYEPTVVKIYKKLGRFLGDWYWLGIRNQAQGFLWKFGKPVDKRFREMSRDERQLHGLWEDYFTLGKFKIIWGYETAHNNNFVFGSTSLYWAFPRITIKGVE